MVKVTHRKSGTGDKRGFWVYEPAGTFKTYKEAIEHYNGKQDWFDKKYHRFTVNGDLYTMTKETTL